MSFFRVRVWGFMREISGVAVWARAVALARGSKRGWAEAGPGVREKSEKQNGRNGRAVISAT